MKFNQRIRNFLLLLFPLYYLINIYSTGSALSQICILTIILISGLYLIKAILLGKNNSLFFIIWTWLLIINMVGFMVDPDLSPGPTREMFRSVLLSMLTFYPFYYFSKKGILTSNHLVIFLLIMIPVFILHFYNLERNMLAERNTDVRGIVNNMAYPFVSLLPYIFLIKRNKIVSGALMLIVIFFIIKASKRGALIAGSIGLLIYFYYTMKTIDKRHYFLGLTIVIVILVVLSAFAYKTFTSNEFTMVRMASILEGQFSGRDFIYKTIFNTWYRSDNLLNLIFGFGFAASTKMTGTFAHSDWLELLSNFGIIGIFLYIGLFYAALKCCLNKKWLLDKRILMITVTSLWFFTSLISMTYTTLDGFIQSILLGYLIGSNKAGLE